MSPCPSRGGSSPTVAVIKALPAASARTVVVAARVSRCRSLGAKAAYETTNGSPTSAESRPSATR
jgi:hypothetical protein